MAGTVGILDGKRETCFDAGFVVGEETAGAYEEPCPGEDTGTGIEPFMPFVWAGVPTAEAPGESNSTEEEAAESDAAGQWLGDAIPAARPAGEEQKSQMSADETRHDGVETKLIGAGPEDPGDYGAAQEESMDQREAGKRRWQMQADEAGTGGKERSRSYLNMGRTLSATKRAADSGL